MTIDEMAQWMAMSLLQHGQLHHRHVIDRIMAINEKWLRMTPRGWYGVHRDILMAFHERTGGREKWSRPRMLWTLEALPRRAVRSARH